jgi:hypothetical protein
MSEIDEITERRQAGLKASLTAANREVAAAIATVSNIDTNLDPDVFLEQVARSVPPGRDYRTVFGMMLARLCICATKDDVAEYVKRILMLMPDYLVTDKPADT